MDSQNVDIVMVRMDRLGDLVLSLPVDQHPVFVGQRVQWFITKGLGFVTEQASPKRRAVEFARSFRPMEFSRMVQWFKANRPTTVIILHAPWWVGAAAWLAGVQHRMGRKSQWHSYLFYNLGVRQKRSQSTQHESDYNFDLVEYGFHQLGVKQHDELPAMKQQYLKILPPNPQASITSRGLTAKGYRVVHPGMGGSALNWPIAHYRELITRLAREAPVLITGTRSDRRILKPLLDLKEAPNVKWMVDELKPYELLDVLSQARSVIAPSTGVVHLAASLGTPTLGIYSPKRVEHPTRWGPKGANVAVLVPDAAATDMIRASVMEQITVDQAETLLLKLETNSPQ